MSYGIIQIRKLRKEIGIINQDSNIYESKQYHKIRDDVIISFLPYKSDQLEIVEKQYYQNALNDNNNYLETELYGDIWNDLLPNERLAIEHLYYENHEFVGNLSRFYNNIHKYIDAKISNNEILIKQYLKYALWEILYNFPADARNELELDNAKLRRKAQATMLNSLNIPLIEIRTPSYISEPIRRYYQSTELENLLPDIVFPLKENARLIADEIQQINSDMQKQLLTLTSGEQKSIISDSLTSKEAAEAFTDLYVKIIDDGTRDFIEKELEKAIIAGRNSIEIQDQLEQSLEHHQDTTISSKVGMLAIHFNGKLSELQQRGEGYTHYIWHSQDDAKVRSDHAANEGKIFSWDNPPPTGHPGEDFNCRCWAEPVIGNSFLDGSDIDDPPIEEVHPELLLIPVLGLRRIAAEGLEAIGKTVIKVFRRKPRLDNTKTWPKPPTERKLIEGNPSRNKPRSRGEKSLYDDNGGEWRYDPGDSRHNPHWNYKPAGKNQEWQNIQIGDLPHLK